MSVPGPVLLLIKDFQLLNCLRTGCCIVRIIIVKNEKDNGYIFAIGNVYLRRSCVTNFWYHSLYQCTAASPYRSGSVLWIFWHLMMTIIQGQFFSNFTRVKFEIFKSRRTIFYSYVVGGCISLGMLSLLMLPKALQFPNLPIHNCFRSVLFLKCHVYF